MKKKLLGMLLAMSLGATAHAASVSNNYFTVEYDDAFWADAKVKFDKDTGTLRFGDLVDQWGLEASARAKRDVIKSDHTDKSWWSILTVTAKSGYVLSSIETGISGKVTANGNAGADAWARSYWVLPDKSSNAESYAYASDNDYNGQYKTSAVASFNGNWGEGPVEAARVGTESFASTASGSGGNTTAILNWLHTGASAWASGSGSNARATINQMSFTVVTAPVPEPETYAMFLAGLGIIGAIARRRSKS